MHITSAFDGGNIKVLEAGGNKARLAIRKDNQSDFYQWFFFRVSGGRDKALTLVIENAADAAYPDGWPGYRACASYDLETWFRVDTDYRDGKLVIRHTPRVDMIHFAYFAPYPTGRHRRLMARAAAHKGVRLTRLGTTHDGRDLDLLEMGAGGKTRPVIWFTARQHPGETMAEWWMEGLLDCLLDENDSLARALLSRVRFCIVPNMNPDGSARGHLRTNAIGVNLNREWDKASMEKSPEVFLTLQKMRETGVDFHMDVHGDEAIPHVFLIGIEGIPSLSERQSALFDMYAGALLALTPDFQREKGYPKDRPGKANMGICSNSIAEMFGCLSTTLEMPFKDHNDNPMPQTGWSPGRSADMARACLQALWRILPEVEQDKARP